jgi:hypothetical protein
MAGSFAGLRLAVQAAGDGVSPDCATICACSGAQVTWGRRSMDTCLQLTAQRAVHNTGDTPSGPPATAEPPAAPPAAPTHQRGCREPFRAGRQLSDWRMRASVPLIRMSWACRAAAITMRSDSCHTHTHTTTSPRPSQVELRPGTTKPAVAKDPRLAARRSARPGSEQVERNSDQPGAWHGTETVWDRCHCHTPCFFAYMGSASCLASRVEQGLSVGLPARPHEDRSLEAVSLPQQPRPANPAVWPAASPSLSALSRALAKPLQNSCALPVSQPESHRLARPCPSPSHPGSAPLAADLSPAAAALPENPHHTSPAAPHAPPTAAAQPSATIPTPCFFCPLAPPAGPLPPLISLPPGPTCAKPASSSSASTPAERERASSTCVRLRRRRARESDAAEALAPAPGSASSPYHRHRPPFPPSLSQK